MKKIIATVLAMVMALALCTTAFAAVQTYDFYDAKTGVATPNSANLELEYHAAKTTSTGATDPMAVAYYTIKGTDGANKLVVCDADEATYIVKYHDSSKIAMYAKSANPEYDFNGKAYTDFGTKCGQFDKGTTYSADDKFYTAVVNKAGDVKLFVGVESSRTQLLVDGKLVPVNELGLLSAVVEQHVWVVDRTAMTAKCSNCGATAKLYKTVAECGTADYEEIAVGLYAVITNITDNTKTDGTSSPKTFDAGIAMYVGMALTSVAGSAVVIGKKKEF